MLIQIRNVLAIAILSVLIVPSGVLSQQPPSPSQPPKNSEKRSPAEHETANNAEHPPRQTPFILDFLSADGLQKISAYCANKPDKDPDPAPVEWKSRFTQKTGAVYVYGAIKYRDAFRIKRFTNFRLYKGGATGVSGPELIVSTDDNKAN